MIAPPRDPVNAPSGERKAGIVVVDVGNSRTHLAIWTDDAVTNPRCVPTNDGPALGEGFGSVGAGPADVELAAVVVACVVPEVLELVEAHAVDRLGLQPHVIGRDLPLPLEVAVDRPEDVGVDRVCAAAAAYEKAQRSCTVIDFGTAVTVDLVDSDGVFQGGAILPGARLQALALSRYTAALPKVTAAFPDRPIGKSTDESIRSGVCHGVVGAARALVERYATHLNHWPYVVATGGDVEAMIGHCDFVDAAVSDLCLRGVGLAYVRHLVVQAGDD